MLTIYLIKETKTPTKRMNLILKKNSDDIYKIKQSHVYVTA